MIIYRHFDFDWESIILYKRLSKIMCEEQNDTQTMNKCRTCMQCVLSWNILVNSPYSILVGQLLARLFIMYIKNSEQEVCVWWSKRNETRSSSIVDDMVLVLVIAQWDGNTVMDTFWVIKNLYIIYHILWYITFYYNRTTLFVKCD